MKINWKRHENLMQLEQNACAFYDPIIQNDNIIFLY